MILIVLCWKFMFFISKPFSAINDCNLKLSRLRTSRILSSKFPKFKSLKHLWNIGRNLYFVINLMHFTLKIWSRIAKNCTCSYNYSIKLKSTVKYKFLALGIMHLLHSGIYIIINQMHTYICAYYLLILSQFDYYWFNYRKHRSYF